jgi:hypothetical protein
VFGVFRTAFFGTGSVVQQFMYDGGRQWFSWTGARFGFINGRCVPVVGG